MRAIEIEKTRFWVDETLEANRRDHTDKIVGPKGDQRGPFRSARALAMALMAMQDAHAGVSGKSTPFMAHGIAAPVGGDGACAAAMAAATVLRALYAKQDALFVARWQAFTRLYGACAQSSAYGAAIGRAYLTNRAGDEVHLQKGGYMPHGNYDHQPDPETPGQDFAGDRWGDAEPFLPGMIRQHLAAPPGTIVADGALPVGTAVNFMPGDYYFAEYAEVKRKGALAATDRTQDEEETGIYWGYDGSQEIGTPPRLYIQVALAVLEERRPLVTPVELLEVLSAAAAAMGDAGIQAWHYKYSPNHMLWRPVVGIRMAEDLAGTPPDPHWLPLGKPETNGNKVGTTPDFPAYPSGHATFGAACFEVLRRYIRKREKLGFTDDAVDSIGFTFVSDEYNGRNTDPRTGQPRRHLARTYQSLWQAIVDNSESRIFLGVHWRMDGISKRTAKHPAVHGSPSRPGELGEYGGVKLGMRIAEAVATARGFA